MRRRRLLGIMLIGSAFVAGTELPAQVSFDRLRRAAAEPHNWLTYSGSYFSLNRTGNLGGRVN